jgi:hypothetical protein
MAASFALKERPSPLRNSMQVSIQARTSAPKSANRFQPERRQLAGRAASAETRVGALEALARVSTTIRPDNLRAALDARLAAAMSRLVDLREAEQPRVTMHLNPREIVGAFLLYARGVYPIAVAFGEAHAGHLQFHAWYGRWIEKLGDANRALWKQLGHDRVQQEHAHGAELIEVEISVASDPSITAPQPGPHVVQKQLVHFAAYPNRAASDVCDDYLQLARRFAKDFVRDHARFLP